jgi:hypothetical protein
MEGEVIFFFYGRAGRGGCGLFFLGIEKVEEQL